MTTIKFDPVKILVVGDLMLDEYIFGKVERISPEAPVPVVWESYTHHILGGAANVANNLVSLGVETSVVGIVGDDENGYRTMSMLEEIGADVTGVRIDFERPTTTKTRIISAGQQLMRVDNESRDDVFYGPMLDDIKDKEFDAVILSDYGKGVLTGQFTREIIELASEKFIAVDPAGKDYGKYRGATMVTPNKKEAEHATGFTINNEETLSTVGGLLSCYVKNVLITVGKDGMVLFEKGENPLHIPTKAQEVYDVSGAGDTVIAAFTLAAATGYSLEDAAHMANAAAAVVVSKIGTATVTLPEIGEKLKEIGRC